ncbi:MAG TPA: heavy metal transport/detoxification protein [Flavisolibacter sp.]|jgi:copper chaperone
MEKYQFKTNINCSACVAKVTPYLNGAKDIKEWTVDTGNPNKILTVETESLRADEVTSILAGAGYKAEKI